MSLPPKHLHILQHSLGRDEYGESKSKINEGEDYRNHFCTGPGSKDFDACKALVADGLMIERSPSQISGGDSIFIVTTKGKEYIALHSPKRPKLTRSKQRYLRFLEYGDGFDSFLQFCKWDAQPERSWNHSAKAP